jgi:hypothetical protein
MNNRALAIYKNVLEAMQDADEIEGVEGDDYLHLMRAIQNEANKRFDNCLEVFFKNMKLRLIPLGGYMAYEIQEWCLCGGWTNTWSWKMMTELQSLQHMIPSKMQKMI